MEASRFLDPRTLNIPERLGHIIESFVPDQELGTRNSPATKIGGSAMQYGGKLIIHLQDLHTQYDAQAALADLIDVLRQSTHVSLVAVEGEAGPGETDFFSAFPDTTVNQRLAEFFLKKGLFTGPVAYAVTHPGVVRLYGAEDPAAYLAHLSAYAAGHPRQQQAAESVRALRASLHDLQTQLYSRELKILTEHATAYAQERLKLSEYLHDLKDLAARHRVSLEAYPNLQRLSRLISLERSIDLQAVAREHRQLMEVCKRSLSAEALQTLRVQQLALQAGQLSPVAYYTSLRDVAHQANVDLTPAQPAHLPPLAKAARVAQALLAPTAATPYTQLIAYTQFLSTSAEIQQDHLAAELDQLVSALKERFFTTLDQRQLDQLLTTLELLDGLYAIRLAPDQWQDYQTHKARFATQPFLDFLARHHRLTPDLRRHLERLFTNLATQEQFYELARTRDAALVANTLKQMEAEDQSVAILVAGGFHTNGMTRLLRAHGVAYAVITPTIHGQLSEELYSSLLLNRVPAITDLVTEYTRGLKTGQGLIPGQGALLPAQGVGPLGDALHVQQGPAAVGQPEAPQGAETTKRSYLKEAWAVLQVAVLLYLEGWSVSELDAFLEAQPSLETLAWRLEPQGQDRVKITLNGTSRILEGHAQADGAVVMRVLPVDPEPSAEAFHTGIGAATPETGPGTVLEEQSLLQEFFASLAAHLGPANLAWHAEEMMGQPIKEGRAFALAGVDARDPEAAALAYLASFRRRFPGSPLPASPGVLIDQLRQAGEALAGALAQVSVVVEGHAVPASSRVQVVLALTEADDPALIGQLGDARHRALIAYGAAQHPALVPISLPQLEAFLEQGETGHQALVEYLRICAQSVVGGADVQPDEATTARVNQALAVTRQRHGRTDWLAHRRWYVDVRTQHALDYAEHMTLSVGAPPLTESASTPKPRPDAKAFLRAFRPAGQQGGPTLAEQRSAVRQGPAAEAVPLAAMAQPPHEQVPKRATRPELVGRPIPSLASDEVACSVKGMKRVFVNPVAATRTLQQQIEEAAGGGHQEVMVGGVRFFRRRNEQQTVWAFHEQDSRAVGRLLGLALQQDQPPRLAMDEVACSIPSFTRLFVGDGERLGKRFTETVVGVIPADVTEAEVSGVRFFKRVHGAHVVWAIKESETAALARLLGAALKEDGPSLPPLGPDEISVTQQGVNRVIVVGHRSIDAFRQQIAPVNEHTSQRTEITVGGVRFFKRVSGRSVVWAFHRNDVDTVAQLLNATVRSRIEIPAIGPDEVAVSFAGLKSVLVGTPSALMKSLTTIIGLPDVTAGPSTTFVFQQGDVHVIFHKRLARTRIVWTFRQADIPHVAALVGVASREDAALPHVGANEMAVARRTLSEIFSGDDSALLKRLTRLLGDANMQQGIEQTLETPAGPVTFAKRRRIGDFVWSFPRAETSKVAALLGVQLRESFTDIPELVEGEIAGVSTELVRVFRGAAADLLVTFRQRLPDPLTTPEHSVTLGVGDGAVTLFKRRGRGSPGPLIWAFQERDISKVAQVFGFSVRPQVPELGPEEIACTIGTRAEERQLLSRFIIGDPPAVMAKLYAYLPTAAETMQDHITIGEGATHVSFVKRRRGSALVWAFHQDQSPQVADLLGIQLRPVIGLAEIGADEVAVSVPSLKSVFAVAVHDLHRQLSARLPEVRRSQEISVVLGEAPLQVLFTKRQWKQSGAPAVWAFARADVWKIAQWFHTPLREHTLPIAADEVACSPAGMAQRFAGDPTPLARAIQRYLPDLRASAEATTTLTIEGQSVTLYKRLSRVHLVWAFKQVDLPAIAHLLGVPLKEAFQNIPELESDEVAWSINGLTEVFVGDLANSAGVPRP